jgi:PAS domain S-box-containing protein
MLNSSVRKSPVSSTQQHGLESSRYTNSTRFFNQLFKTSAAGVALIDSHDRFISMNEAFCDILGYSAEELQRMRCEQILSPFAQRNPDDAVRTIYKQRTSKRKTEQVLFRKDQSLMPARIWFNPVQHTELEEPLSVMMIEDISEQEEAQHELNKRKIEVEVLASRLIQAREVEQNRLSRELHDDIGQRLSLVASEVSLMASGEPTGIAVGRLEAVREELDTLCSDVHCMSHDLHSYKLQHLGLKCALNDLSRRFSKPDFCLNIHIDESDEPRSKEVSLCLYRVAQEAINNALRHSRSSVAVITVAKVQNFVYMTIQDIGIGFKQNSVPLGLGLISMTERVKLVGGQLKLSSIPGRGTEIWAAIPDREDADSSEDLLGLGDCA